MLIVVFYPAPVILLLFPLAVALMLLEGLALSLVSRKINILTGIYLRALVDACGNWREVLRSRRKAMKIRKNGWLEVFRGFRLMPQKIKLLLAHGIPIIRA